MGASAKPVSPPDPSAPERILGEDGGRAYRRFLAWTVGDGFAMAVIEVRSPAQRRELLAWTAAEMPGTRVAPLDQASGKPLRPLLERACPAPGGADVLVITRLEDAPDRIKLFARINIQRDELTRAFPVPWVVLIHPAAALEMQQHAPDFSDFAGLWLNEERDEAVAVSLEAFEQLGLESMSLAAPTVHISAGDGSPRLLRNAYNAFYLSKYDEVIDLLAQYDMRYPDARTYDPQRIRLDSLLLKRRGQPLEALARLEEARRLCDPVGNKLVHAAILGDIARLRTDKGEVDAALALHNEVLQVYEEMGDRRARAAALGDIAHLRAQKGEVDIALALHNEALQVYEELGDRRSRAATLGDIARRRAQKGEVDAALALHNEALQVYEELGDRRSRAIALGDIADLRAHKGEVDIALALMREQLKLNEELSDPEGVANAHWLIGKIAIHQRDWTTALEHVSMSYAISSKLGQMDAICVVGLDLAKILLVKGRRVEAIPILVRSRDGFLRLGRLDFVNQVQELIDSTADNP